MDARELTEADEFSGTAALKAYNTFMRPRPKQLSKVCMSTNVKGCEEEEILSYGREKRSTNRCDFKTRDRYGTK